MKTKVIFYLEKNNPDVFAFFPHDPYNSESGMFTCYAHIGQHSACHTDYLKGCELAIDYADLKTELENIGYDLDIVNEYELKYHREPTTYEIRFGEGATHYRDFPASECLKIGLDFKKWLKADDGLRYYR